MCLHNFIAISPELWPADVCEHSKNVIIAPVRLYPRVQGVRPQKFFLHIFSWVRAITPKNLQFDISKKILGKNFLQGGPTPKIF